MKTRISTLVSILLVTAIFCGCVRQLPPDTNIVKKNVKSINSLGKFPYNSTTDELSIVEIDNCEYIVCNAYSYRDIAITHKGNCKFCVERNK